MPPFPPGIEVELSDGRRGVVAHVKLERIDRPVVRIGYDARGTRIEPYELDLSEEPELRLTAVEPGMHAAREPVLSTPRPELRVA